MHPLLPESGPHLGQTWLAPDLILGAVAAVKSLAMPACIRIHLNCPLEGLRCC